MTNDNQDVLTAEDHKLFLDIAKEIRKNPPKYHEAGKWLDEYCSDDAYWQRQQTKLEESHRKKTDFPVLENIRRLEQIELKIKERQSPALYIRFKEAQNYLLKKYKNEQFIPEDDAKQIILITWLLTDPDAEKADIGITKFEKWLCDTTNDITKISRRFALSLWIQNKDGYKNWMKLVRVAWLKISQVIVETGSLPTKVEKLFFARNFLSNLLRASIKHFPFGGAFLYDVIYGTLDSQEFQKQTTPKPKTPQSSAISEKHRTVAKHKPDAEKTYQNVSLKIAKITLYAAIITLVGAILTSPLWRPVIEKWIGEPNMTKKISSEKKLLYSLKEICQDIDSRPLVQRVETAKRYIGIKIERERLKLFDIHEYPEDGTFGLTMTLPDEIDESYLTGRKIFCTVERNQYPELNAAKKGLQLYVSGQIKDAGSSYIRLSDVSLSFE